MLEQHVVKGAADACAHFGLKLANVPGAAPAGVMGKLKGFGQGQLDAGKALIGNLRGGMGGAPTPAFHEALNAVEGPINPGQWHREQALGNLKTLAPTLLAGGALYMLHQRKKQKEQQARQQAMMMQQGYGQPPM